MKKVFALLFAFVLIFSLAGCATITALPKTENIPEKDTVNTPVANNAVSQDDPIEQTPEPTQTEPAPTQIEPEPTQTEPAPTPEPTTPKQPEEQEPEPSESQPPAKKTKSEAKAIALAHANAKESAVRDFEIELERDEAIPHYDISFDWDGKEYEYEIDLYSGKILKSHAEADNDQPAETPAGITAKEAKAAALAHAKVKESALRDYEAEKETERKQTFYEISFHAGGYDYEYKVDATSGKILHWEKELDD